MKNGFKVLLFACWITTPFAILSGQSDPAEESPAVEKVDKTPMVDALKQWKALLEQIPVNKKKNLDDQLIAALISTMQKVDCSKCPLKFKKAWGNLFYELQKYERAKARTNSGKLMGLVAALGTGGGTALFAASVNALKPGADEEGVFGAIHKLHNVLLDYGVIDQ